MKSLITLTIAMLIASFSNAQTKKDGTPDMRYNNNKNMYNTPTYSAPTYNMPSNTAPKYNNGGQLYTQPGYIKSNGTVVEPHIKTKPDNKKWNNVNPN